jgi:hydroxymethylbilane synthase
MIRIGTRDSKLAVWQAELVQQQLIAKGFPAELVLIKSEGDIDLHTPLYAMGVQGVFTRSLDIALLSNRIDIAVHSMKDVPTQLPQGIVQAAVLQRGPVHDLLVFRNEAAMEKYTNAIAQPLREGLQQTVSMPYDSHNMPNQLAVKDAGMDSVKWTIATSSIRRKSQWLHRFPNTEIHNIRGNVITRLRKLQEESWDAVIFAQAGVERIGVRPKDSLVLDWMLPAPAQGAIMVVCRQGDSEVENACAQLNHAATALSSKIERDFLKTLLGGCSTPISALATVENNLVHFKGNIYSLDGRQKAEVDKMVSTSEAENLGILAAEELLHNGGQPIADAIKGAK